jgi:hypothetical protein
LSSFLVYILTAPAQLVNQLFPPSTEKIYIIKFKLGVQLTASLNSHTACG